MNVLYVKKHSHGEDNLVNTKPNNTKEKNFPHINGMNRKLQLSVKFLHIFIHRTNNLQYNYIIICIVTFR